MFPSYAVDKIAKLNGLKLKPKLRLFIMNDARFRELSEMVELRDDERWSGSASSIFQLFERFDFFVGDCQACGGRVVSKYGGSGDRYFGKAIKECLVCRKAYSESILFGGKMDL